MDNAAIYGELLKIGVAKSYASEIARGKRKPSLPYALRIFRKTGLRLGPLKDLSTSDIETVARINSRAA